MTDAPGPGDAATGTHDLAHKLNRLFAVVHAPGRGPYTNTEVAAAITKQFGVSISDNYLSMLRNGHRTNPTLRHVQGLALFFGVDPNYFFDSAKADEVEQELDLIGALRDAGIRNLAVRSAGVSPAAREAIRAFIEHVARLEQQNQDTRQER